MTNLSPKASRYIIMAIEARIAALEHSCSLKYDDEDTVADCLNDIGFYKAIVKDLEADLAKLNP